MGSIAKDLLNAVKESLKTELDVDAKLMNPIKMSKEFYNPVRHQYISDKILNFLSEKFKDKTLAITDEDLYTENLNFVFGQAQLAGRVAIVSIHRLRPEFYGETSDKNLLVERTIKETVHEVGHTLGLNHCENKKCVMNFSNSISDVDRKNKNLCENCRIKLQI
jgi:archaemetzincin